MLFMKRYFAAVLFILSSCNKEAAIYMPAIYMTPINAKGEILFISRRIPNSADWQMFLMNADGTNQRAVLNDLVRCAPPVLSNSRTKIAFVTYDINFNYRLYVVDTNGQTRKLLS